MGFCHPNGPIAHSWLGGKPRSSPTCDRSGGVPQEWDKGLTGCPGNAISSCPLPSPGLSLSTHSFQHAWAAGSQGVAHGDTQACAVSQLCSDLNLSCSHLHGAVTGIPSDDCTCTLLYTAGAHPGTPRSHCPLGLVCGVLAGNSANTDPHPACCCYYNYCYY